MDISWNTFQNYQVYSWIYLRKEEKKKLRTVIEAGASTEVMSPRCALKVRGR